MTDELANFLGELAGEGQVDSRGHFTLDLEKAYEKLRRFQLPTPYHFVLSLVACACSLSASRFAMEHRDFEFQATFDGGHFEFDDLKDIFGSFLTVSSLDPFRIALRELALAVHGARGLRPQYIIVESWGGSRGARMIVQGDSLEVEPLTGSPFRDPRAQTVFRMRERESAWKALTARLLSRPAPTEELLRTHCCWAEAQILLQNRPINMTRLGAWPALARVNRAGGVRSPDLNPRRNTFSQSLKLNAPFAGYLGFGDGPGGILLVVNGVLFQPTVDVGYRTALAVLYVPSLAKDLSQSRLVEDERFQAVIRQLAEGLDQLVLDVVAAGMSLAEWMVPALVDYYLRVPSLEALPPVMLRLPLFTLADQRQVVSLESVQQQGGNWSLSDPPPAEGLVWAPVLERFFPR